MDQQDGPIGVFDSGVGGLAVLRELHRVLPAEDFVYFADRANFPYGPRAAGEVCQLALAAGERLVEAGAKLLVVACNTASSAALPALRSRFPIPVVGIEPALKPACAITTCGRVGVLATSGTVQGAALDHLADRVAGDVRILRVAAPRLVELVERGEAATPLTMPLVTEALRPLIDAGVDVVVLGCTHFAFLRTQIQRVLGPGVQVLEPASAVALQVERVLRACGLARSSGRSGTIRYLSSGDAESLRRAAELLDVTGG
ncbi:MAG: glutamate racemase [Dehalococcoidia bacterium]